jgi:hypothetical protein
MRNNEPQIGEPIGNNPEDLSRLLEIELIQKRAEWQRATTRHKNLKAASLLFLVVVVFAGLVAGYFAYSRASEERQQRPAQTAPEQGQQ